MTLQKWPTLNGYFIQATHGKDINRCYMLHFILGTGRGRCSDECVGWHPDSWWGVLSNNLPSDLSHSDKWDDFSSQGGAWVARD